MSVTNINVKIEELISLSKAIYIIDPTGILLFHEYFFNEVGDPDLYAGLFTAVSVFSSELGAGNIKQISLDETKFVFRNNKEANTIIILEMLKNVSDEDTNWLLDQIQNRYYSMAKMMNEDYKGSLTLTTLFDERGKSIDWDTIKEIREDAIKNQQFTYDKVDTLNLTPINLNNKFWVKNRRIITSLVENQKGLTGMIFMVKNKSSLNILYSGRKGHNKLDKIIKYMKRKFEDDTLGIELETEYIQIDDQYVAIYPIFCAEGGMIGVASIDRYLITNRLSQLIERLVASIEKLATRHGL